MQDLIGGGGGGGRGAGGQGEVVGVQDMISGIICAGSRETSCYSIYIQQRFRRVFSSRNAGEPRLFAHVCGWPRRSFTQITTHMALLRDLACTLKYWFDGKCEVFIFETRVICFVSCLTGHFKENCSRAHEKAAKFIKSHSWTWKQLSNAILILSPIGWLVVLLRTKCLSVQYNKALFLSL